MSVVSFATYGWDKRRAARTGRRIPEKTLLTIDLLGGWPGGLVAQRVFRHKKRKSAYMIRFWGVVALHAGVLTWLLVEHDGRF